MFVSNMKILTLNSKQNDSLSTPATTIHQQLVQTGEAYSGGGTCVDNTQHTKEFGSHNNGGGSAQKTTIKIRDQHQKHSGTNKAKYNHSNNGNKTQQSQQTQQKYHHSSNNNKNKKQHYNNNNSSSSLSRKKFYQQQQSTLQQKIQYHHQQKHQQYLPTSPHTSQQLQKHTTKAATTPAINNITASNNNNSISVKNQNYTVMHNPNSETNTDNITPSTISDECTCGAFENSGCDKLSSSTETQNQQVPHHSRESNLNLNLPATTTKSNNISPLQGHRAPSQPAAPPSCSYWSNTSSVPPQKRSGNLIANKSAKFSVTANKTNLQDFVAAAFAHKCSCQMNSTVPAVNLHTTSISKKTTFWKNANTGGGSSGGDTISTCSVSPKLSNDKEDVTEKFGTTNDACSCRRPLRNIAELADEKNISNQNFQKADITADFSNKGSTVVAKVSRVANTLPCGSNVGTSDISSPMASPVWQQQSKNSTLPVEVPKKQNDECNKVARSSSTDNIKIDSDPSKGGAAPTHVSGRGSLSPNAYTLDFLHSVGVQMTGGSNNVSLDAPLESGNNNGVSEGTPLQHGNRTTVNSIPRTTHSYMGITNPRQPRNMVGVGNGNNGHHYRHQQHHYHHHPPQLTIASFLHKDLLGESNAGQMQSSGRGSATGGSSNYSEQRGNIQQQHYTRHHQHARYQSNIFQTPHYQQQQTHSTHSAGYASSVGGSVGGEFSRMATNVGNQRPIYGSFPKYHIEASGGNNLLEYHQMNQQQNQFQNNKSQTQNNVPSKKASHCSSSSSSCSSSSSNSSFGSHQKHQQQQTIHRQQKSSSTINSAIETLPSKFSNQHLSQMQGHQYRGGHYHGHNYHSHHNHQGHHQQALPNTPTTPQHQNYYNLTYVCTDENIVNANSSTTASRGCSPAPQPSAPTPISTSTHSQKGLKNTSGAATMLSTLPQNRNQVNYSRCSNTQNSTAPQFLQYQQQKYLNKKFLVPLTLTLSSLSPSPTTLTTQQLPIESRNIICCSQLDEATQAAAAAAAKTGVIAGNEYDSDKSSTQYDSDKSSTAVLNSEQILKYQPLKSLTTSHQASQDCHSLPGTPTLLYSPLDYAHAPTLAGHTFPGSKVISTGTQHQQQQMLNQEQLTYKSANIATGTALPQIYRNSGVISLLNLPSQSPNRCGGSSSNFLDNDYHQRKQPHHLYLTHHQSSAEHLNALSLATNSNSSNSSSGYWSPSHQCNFLYHQLPSGSTALMTSNTHSCGSSSSVSPCLTEQGDELKHELGNNYQHIPSSGGSSPSSCLNEQLVGNHITSSIGDCSSVHSSSSNSSVSGQSGSCSLGIPAESNSKNGSAQFLPAQQQHSTAQQQQTCSSSPTIFNCSSSALSNTFRQQQQTLIAPNNSVGGIGNSSSGPPQTFPQMLPYQHSFPPLPLTHNLLYTNPQTHHIRPINNASMHDFFTHTPPDRFLARAHLIEAKETPTFLLNSSKWDNLSQGIWKKFVCSQQTEETFKQKMRLWRFLYLFIKNAYPRYGLYLVGSTISGFGSDTSDVDMCLVSRSASSIDPRMEALFNLTILRDCLSKSGEFENFNLIEAKVPILRFCDRVHQIEVDLNFNNCVGIKNTHLLYCYSQLDWRLRPLVLVTKLWAQHHNINNAKNMTISSYSLVLMVIHFLQYAVNPPVLPCLHDMFPDKFPLLRSNDFGYVDMNETLGPYESKNNKTIGELFLNLLEYYSCFDYTKFAISVRTGGTLPINECRIAKSIKNDPHQWKELCIEEPFDLTNTARSVYDYETFERVKAVIVSSWHVLQSTLDLNSVFLPTTELPTTSSPPQAAGDARSVTHLGETAEKIAQAFENTQISSNTIADDFTSVSITEEIAVLRSSIKQTTKYGDTKIVQAQYHKGNLYEKNFSGASTITTANSSVVSSSYNTKGVSTSGNIGTAILS